MNKEQLDNGEIPVPKRAFDSVAKDWEVMAGKTLPELKKEILAKQIPELKRHITGLGTAALNVFDIEENKFLHVDDTIEEVTGIPKALYFSKGPKYVFTRATISHIPGILSSTYHQTRFFKRLPATSYDDFIVNREFSYRGERPKWVLHQVLKHLRNPKGKIFATAMLQTDISFLKNDTSFRYYIYDKKANTICHPKNTAATSATNIFAKLTTREIDIIELLKQGFSNRQIATNLNISFHTVRTHRKNIFKKLNCSNVVELIRLLN